MGSNVLVVTEINNIFISRYGLEWLILHPNEYF